METSRFKRQFSGAQSILSLESVDYGLTWEGVIIISTYCSGYGCDN